VVNCSICMFCSSMILFRCSFSMSQNFSSSLNPVFLAEIDIPLVLNLNSEDCSVL
jgi:hypothetical protein